MNFVKKKKKLKGFIKKKAFLKKKRKGLRKAKKRRLKIMLKNTKKQMQNIGLFWKKFNFQKRKIIRMNQRIAF